jgi:hypothetical protein
MRRRLYRIRALRAVLAYLQRYDKSIAGNTRPETAAAEAVGRQRIQLAKLADKLDYYSKPIGRPLTRRAAVHPIALMMRATARNIRALLNSRASLTPQGFDDVTLSLRRLSVCLAESIEGNIEKLADEVEAFTADGIPAEDLRTHLPGTWSRVVRTLSAAMGADFERPTKLSRVFLDLSPWPRPCMYSSSNRTSVSSRTSSASESHPP